MKVNDSDFIHANLTFTNNIYNALFQQNESKFTNELLYNFLYIYIKDDVKSDVKERLKEVIPDNTDFTANIEERINKLLPDLSSKDTLIESTIITQIQNNLTYDDIIDRLDKQIQDLITQTSIDNSVQQTKQTLSDQISSNQTQTITLIEDIITLLTNELQKQKYNTITYSK